MATKNPTPTSPGEPDKTSRVRWLRRMAGYAFWTALGAMLPLALDRLIIHPILNQELGADVFGAFIWVLGIVNLFGNVAANGFVLLLMRDHARQEHAVATRMFRTALILTAILSIIILPVALGASDKPGRACRCIWLLVWELHSLFRLEYRVLATFCTGKPCRACPWQPAMVRQARS